MRSRRQVESKEAGFILLMLIFMVALLLIALAVAAPRIATSIQRDREAELIHRGEQYKRAIKLYYKKFGRYPSTIDQLVNTNNMRFLRKRYVDPMTGKDDWKIIHFGEAHVKPMGLFGQPISNGGLSTTAGSSALGGAPSGGIGAPSVGTPIGGSTPSSSTDSSTGSSTTPAGATGTPSGSLYNSSPGSDSGSGSSTDSFGSSSSSSSFGSSSSSSSFGSSGQSFGGAPIVGVASKNTKASIKEYKKQKHYNEWEFVYDPLEDMLSSVSLLGGGGNINGSSSSTGTGFGSSGTGSSSTPFSNGPGSSSGSGFGSGSGSGFGSSPTSPQQ